MACFVVSNDGRFPVGGAVAARVRPSCLSHSKVIAHLTPYCDAILGMRNPNAPFLVGPISNARPIMSRFSYLAVCAALALATAACGETPGERALTGGAIGAGGGALVGAAAGNPAAGAIVGGLGGAAVGAATTPRRYYY
jgi:hypothetical protein